MALAPLLANLTICCTGVEEDIRASVQKKTEALGGRYSAHLTKECTHLIAGCVAKSPKYKSALKFGIPVVQVSWIDECWNSAHLNSGPIEDQRRLLFQMALRKYAVSGLQGCLISVTGVAFDERSKICSMVQELGGIYSPELKPQCSHLIYESISETDRSSQPVQLPIKVQYAFKWDIPVVSKDWIYACYSQRILLEESDYFACTDIGLENTATSEILPLKLSDIRENTTSFLHGCHIYLVGDSISAQKLAVLKRLILAAGGFRYTDLESSQLTHIVIHNQLLPNNLREFLDQQPKDSEIKLVHDNWLFDSFKEGKRLSEDDYEVIKKNTPSSQSQPRESSAHKWKSAFSTNTNPAANLSINNSHNGSFLNANANISFGTPRTSFAGGEEFLAGTPNVMESAAKVLKGKCVYLGILSSIARVQKLSIKARRAEMVIVENEIEADWCITSVLISVDLYKKMTLHRTPNDLRNEIWFEAALDSKTNLPAMNFAYPLTCSASLPLANFSKFIMSQSGFSGAEREFYTEMIKSTGAQYTDSLSKSNTHLFIAEPRSGTKFEFAKKWKIKCVDLNWFKEELKQQQQQQDFSLSQKGSNEGIENNVNHSYKVNSQLSQAKLSFQSLEIFSSNTLPTTLSSIPTSNNNEDGFVVEEQVNLFKGLVFASSQRLWHRRDELSGIIESLGGVFLWSFDQTCTHYLHQGKLVDEIFKEFKQARQWGKVIVSPWWILKCKESGKRLDESNYPHTFKNESKDESDSIDRIKESSNQVVPPQVNLDWNAIMAKKRADELLLRPGSKTFNIEAHSTIVKLSDQSNEVIKSTDPLISKQYQIVFSGYTSAERAELIKLIAERPEFRITLDDATVNWNPKSTILISNSLNFTEKIFSACATGCWILKKEFLSDSTFNFEKYEIGPAWNANERDTLIGRAPKYWRQRLGDYDSNNSNSDSDLRPFSGWKCALIVESTRQALYESVLRNGGADVFSVPNITTNPSIMSQITHFFCANLKSVPEDLRKLLKNDQIFPTKHITNTIFRLND